MRFTAIVATCIVFATTAHAGNPDPAPTEPVVVTEPAPSGTNGHLLVPLLALIFVVGGLSN